MMPILLVLAFLLCAIISVVLLSMKATRKITLLLFAACTLIFLYKSYINSRPKILCQLAFSCNYTAKVLFSPTRFIFSSSMGVLVLRIADKEGEILLEKELYYDYLLKDDAKVRLENMGNTLRVSEDIRQLAWIANERFEVAEVEWIEAPK